MSFIYKIILIILFQTGLHVFSQKSTFYQMYGETGNVLFKIDSLSLKKDHYFSVFCIDSISQVPYSGKAVKLYGINVIDSMNFKDGYLDGWLKSYSKNNNKWTLKKLEFYNQYDNIFISNFLTEDLRPHLAIIKFETKNLSYYSEINYKKKRIILRQTILSYNKKEVRKLSFKTTSELENYLKGFEPSYEYCKLAGLFSIVCDRNNY